MIGDLKAEAQLRLSRLVFYGYLGGFAILTMWLYR